MQYLQGALKWGFGAIVALLIGCFNYGLFNRFVFLHGAAPAGIESGLAYAMFFGMIGSPFALLIGALVGVATVWWRKRHQ